MGDFKKLQEENRELKALLLEQNEYLSIKPLLTLEKKGSRVFVPQGAQL
jgi:hypothetical protein